MLQNYQNLSDALDKSLDTFDALAAISFDLDRQTRVVQQEYWALMAEIGNIFGLDIMVAQRELEDSEL